MGISKDLTEEDIKFRYINEAITSKGWSKDSVNALLKDDTAYLGNRCEGR